MGVQFVSKRFGVIEILIKGLNPMHSYSRGKLCFSINNHKGVEKLITIITFTATQSQSFS